LPAKDIYQNGDILYLSVFNNSAWVPIAWREVEDGKVNFRHLEPGVLFQLTAYSAEKAYSPESDPFILCKDGSIYFARPDTVHRYNMRLTRKYRLPDWWKNYLLNAIGGKFQGANRADFSDATTLYTIREEAVMRYIDLYPKHSQAFKYIRYLSGEKGYNNMAELQFFSQEEQLQGEVIGTEGLAGKSKQHLFDGDPLTYFHSRDMSGGWGGLEFEQARRITHIRYWFRNDDNTVRPGDMYELFYWGENSWVSMGTQLANDTLLYYNQVPSCSIYWLRDHTRGRQERPFSYERDTQVWW
jgi:hypothetical protein